MTVVGYALMFACPCGQSFETRADFSIHLQVAHTPSERAEFWTAVIGPNKTYTGTRDQAHAERLKDARANRT